jgi:hypothetical protein
MAGGAELIGFRKFQTADEAARETDTDDKSNQPSGRYAEKEPTLRSPPEPCGKPSTRRLRRIHFEPLNMAMSYPLFDQ